jgi:hypothetical protein
MWGCGTVPGDVHEPEELPNKALAEQCGNLAIAGDSPVCEIALSPVTDPKYGGTRETLSESGEPTLQG